MQQQQIKEIREAFIAFFSGAFNKHSDGDVQCLFDAADAQAGTLNFKIFVTFQPDESCWISVKSLNEKLRNGIALNFMISGCFPRQLKRSHYLQQAAPLVLQNPTR